MGKITRDGKLAWTSTLSTGAQEHFEECPWGTNRHPFFKAMIEPQRRRRPAPPGSGWRAACAGPSQCGRGWRRMAALEGLSRMTHQRAQESAVAPRGRRWLPVGFPLWAETPRGLPFW
ncbi:hypothetical protein NDU88_009343 [Pleurodeles waltl]|uniref:Uncharacterized protein n=1 Tax=Pleurodeles waltl TaxID=8319 RepID=A0AAV7QR94_PLEWA|nr:hypothetical protein NDU88_009343 [Pleurodeles waltl]